MRAQPPLPPPPTTSHLCTEIAQHRCTAFEPIRTGAAAQTLQEPSQALREGSRMHSSQQSTRLCLHLLYMNVYKLLSLASPL